MVLRKAQKGKFAGQHFFGCSGYPGCRGIVNYEQDVHGPIEEVIEKRIDRSQTVDIDLPPVPERRRLSHPVPFECQPTQEGLQCRLFENAALPEEVPGIVFRAQTDQRLLRSVAQWRLDFPLPRSASFKQDLRSVLAVTEKILLRGSSTICSPNVDNLIREKLIGNREITDNAWVEAIEQVALAGLDIYDHQKFDSQEEDFFYHSLLPDLAGSEEILSWTVPQVALSSLASGSIVQASNQRVDFLISHPKSKPLVVEIDGLQHRDRGEQDQRRDSALESHGLAVLRIPVAEIRTRSGSGLDQLRDHLEEISNGRYHVASENLQLSLLLSRTCGRVQIAILEALKTGYLSPERGSNWNLFVARPHWIKDHLFWNDLIRDAIEDFRTLLESINRLHNGKDLGITFKLIDEPEIESSSSNPAIEINFGVPKNGGLGANSFYISEVYVPNYIAQPLPVSAPVTDLSPDYDTVEYLLHYIFRKDRFWDGQWDAIERTLYGKDSLVLLPTGGGKSIAFQLASLLLPGPCLVVDPLIALIDDQVHNLKSAGIDRVVGITRLLDYDERRIAMDSFASGNYIFCYVAPERLQMEDFREALRAVTTISPISVIAIDEAHCVSEWGHDFRTAYLNVARNARNYCEHQGYVPPMLGLSGTASRSVLKDVQRELEILDFDALVTPESFDRPELNFRVVHCRSDEKSARLRGYLASLPGIFGISQNVFFLPRGRATMAGLVFYPHVRGEYGVTDGYQDLKQQIGNIGFYSGKSPKGIPSSQWDYIKSAFAEQFKNDELTLLVCTKGFGMGIDKPNIRYTVHMNLPPSIEAFYQEAGRAGRDRNSSDCCLIVSNDDPARSSRLLGPTTPIEEIAQIVQEAGWDESDDIVRMMYFHTNSFRGSDNEIRSVTQLVDEIGDLRKRRKINIPYTAKTRNQREKSVHRLVILGVVEDYTTDYANEMIRIQVSGVDKAEIMDAYVNYIQSYNRRQSQVARQLISQNLHLGHREFLLFVIRNLVEFIYSTIELGRRRSLSEMLLAATSGTTDEDIRRHILNYLELGQYSEILDLAMERSEDLPTTISELSEQISSPNEGAELRGQTARLLESYPDNPALLLIRSFAELLCRDRSEEVVLENLIASVRYALSETGWALDVDEVSSAVVLFADRARPIRSALGVAIIERYLAESRDRRSAARKIIEEAHIEHTSPAVNILMSLLIDRVDRLVLEGGSE